MQTLNGILSLVGISFFLGKSIIGCSGEMPTADLELDSNDEALSSKCAPAVPDPVLSVPAGNNVAFSYEAQGVQIYQCTVDSAQNYTWTFQAPSATLYARRGRVAGTHYAGPTWESIDGSTVVGTKLAGFTVDSTSIPWLLLQATASTGTGQMSRVTYIQRLNTVGGLAPATGCDVDHVGTIANVDYTATYYFFEAANRPPCGCK